MDKISVIVAAYNVEEYIEEAVCSVMEQTLRDVEIIIVDDCSTDNTPKILETLAKKDSRIRLIRHETNLGLLKVRKTGISAASGDYIMFLDGDDMLTPYACEEAAAAMSREDVDMIQFDAQIVAADDSDDVQNRSRGFGAYLKSPTHRILTTSSCGLLDTESIEGKIVFTVWNKVYRTDLLKRVNRFLPDEYLYLAEDVLFSFLVQHEARSYAYLSKKLYRYRFGSGISTRATVSEKQLDAWAKVAFVYKYLEKQTQLFGTADDCKARLLQVKQQLLDNIADMFLRRVPVRQKKYFFSAICRYCSVEDFVLAVSNYAYKTPAISEESAVRDCALLDAFKPTPRKVKRVGVYYFRLNNGGIENVVSLLSKLWVNQGYEVVLFTDEAPNKEDYPLPTSVKRVIVPGVKTQSFEPLQSRILAFRKAIVDSEIDIMVYNAWISPLLLVDEMIIKSCGVPLIVHTHSLFCCDVTTVDSNYAYRNTALPNLYSLVDTIVTLSDVDVAWWQAHGLRAMKTVNPVGLPLTVEPAKLGGHQMLMVCRISPEKQVLEAIQIAELVREQIPDATLTIVGKGDFPEYVAQIEGYVQEHELESFVKLAGFSSDMYPFYRDADVLISTSTFEGFGLALMESKICGLPMVCFELPNLDIMRENMGMEIVPQGDKKAAADAIVSIFRDDEKKHRMGREARESAEKICGMDLGAYWNYIFEETMKPIPVQTSLCQKAPLEIAVNLATEFHSKGILNRRNCFYQASPAPTVQTDLLTEEVRACREILDGIANSESYRIGLALTFVPRKIFNLFRGKKKKTPEATKENEK